MFYNMFTLTLVILILNDMAASITKYAIYIAGILLTCSFRFSATQQNSIGHQIFDKKFSNLITIAADTIPRDTIPRDTIQPDTARFTPPDSLTYEVQ